MAFTDPEIRNMLILSTAHLTEDEARALDKAEVGTAWADRIDSGYFCYVPLEKSSDEAEYPKRVRPMLDLARKHGCDHIRFDCDGPVMEGLDVFHW